MIDMRLMGHNETTYLLQLILSFLELEVFSDGYVLPRKFGDLCTVKVVH